MEARWMQSEDIEVGNAVREDVAGKDGGEEAEGKGDADDEDRGWSGT